MGTEVEILLKTRAELQGARQLEEQLQRDIGKAKALGKEYADLDAQLKKVQATIAASKPAGPGFGDVFGKLREGLGNIVPGFAKVDGMLSGLAGGTLAAVGAGFAVLAVAIETARRALHEFAGTQEAVASMDAALAQTGQLAEPLRQHMQALAESLQDLTAIPNEQWISALTRLIQFGADASNIDELSTGIKNLAGIMGGDIQGASVVLSKAMQGNFEMLSRFGIHVDTSKTKTEQLNDVLQQIALRGGAQLEARAESLSGTFHKLTNGVSDLLKALGQMLFGSERTQSSLRGFAELLGRIAAALGHPIDKLRGLHNAAVTTVGGLDQATSATGRLADAQVGLAGAISGVEGALDREMRKIDQQLKQEVEVLQKQKQLQLEKAKLEPDAEKRARLIAGINTAFGGAEDAAKGKANQGRLGAIGKEESRVNRDVAELSEEIQRLQEQVPKVQEYRRRSGWTAGIKGDLEKAEDELAEKRALATGAAGSLRDKQIAEGGRSAGFSDKTNAMVEALPETQAYKEQQQYVVMLRQQLKDAQGRETEARMAIPGIGLEGNIRLRNGGTGTLEQHIEDLQQTLNELVGKAVPRLEQLQGDRETIQGDEQQRKTLRGLDNQIDRLRSRGDIKEGQDQNNKNFDQQIDDFNKGRIPTSELKSSHRVALSAISDSTEETKDFFQNAAKLHAISAQRISELSAELSTLRANVENRRLA